MARIRLVFRIVVCLAFVMSASVSSCLFAQQTLKKPVVEKSPLLKEPTTPEEMFAAVVLMVDLARTDLAAKYLEQFSATNPDDEMLIQLRDKFGTGEFVKLAASPNLQPLSTNLLQQLNTAAKKQADNPVFVDGLINRLLLGTQERDLAITELRNAGASVVPEIIRKMAAPEFADHQDTLVIALTKMGNQVIPPLIGALDSPDERIRAAVINTLGWLDASEAIPYLWYPAFDEEQPSGVRNAARRTLIKLLKGSPERGTQLSSVFASTELKRFAKMLYRTPSLLPVDEQGKVNLWAWDENADTVVAQPVSPEIAAMFLSSRFARQSLALSPEQPEQQRQYLAALLGLEVLRQGWDKPRVASPGSAMYLGLTAGEETVSQVLSESLEAGRAATSVAALEILGQNGTREQLLSQRGLKSPVIAALNSPDPRVQFAAAVTVLKLNPKTGFSGSNRVVEILSRSLSDEQQSRAIVIDSDSQRASLISAFLSDAGYEGIMASSGRTGFEQAATLAGVDIIAVHVNSQRWDLTQTLSNLRADSRTAAVPLVIYGTPNLREEMVRVVARHSPAIYVTETSTASDFLGQVLPFMKTVTTTPLSASERHQQKQAAAYWLATIGSGSLARVFDISKAEKDLSIAIETPATSTNSLIAMASIPKPSAQRRLADVTLNPQLDETTRQTAANQLAYHIQRFGLMLKKDEVAEVHSGWKSTDNPTVKSALASVIGSLRPNATIVSERLKQFPVPPAN